MYGRCQYLLGDRTKAEDAMQDVFAKALGHWHEFRNESSPLTWLVRIATHHCLNVLRAERAPWHKRFERETRARGEGHGGAAAVRGSRGGAEAAREAGRGDAAGGDSLLRRRDDAGRGRGRDRPIDPDRAQTAGERDGAARDEIKQLKVTHELGNNLARRTHRRADAAAAAGGRGAGAGRPGDRRARDVVRGLPRAHPRARRRAAPLRAGDLVRPLRRRRRAGGARREQGAARPVRARVWMAPMVAMAACAGRDDHVRAAADSREAGATGPRAAAAIIVRVAGADGQRDGRVDATEALARGERLRIGYQPGDHRYLLSLSIDDRGEVTPLYPERGPSLTRARRLARARRVSCPTAWS